VRDLEFFVVENSSHLNTGAHPRLEEGWFFQAPNHPKWKYTKTQILVDTISKPLHDLPFSQN
jgi:hypothetical protein